MYLIAIYRIVTLGARRTLTVKCAGDYLPWGLHAAGDVAGYEYVP